MVNLKEFLAIQIVILISIFAINYFFLKDNSSNKEKTEIINKIDTVYIEIERKEINIKKGKAKIRKTDSIEIKANPFISQLDTIVTGDTISMSYIFPENTFDLKLNPKSDSLLVQNFIKERIIYEEEKWWENPLYIILGIIIGYITAIL